MLGPVRVRTPDGGRLTFFGTFASFDTPFEVTTSELAIELLFPADRTTAETLLERSPASVPRAGLPELGQMVAGAGGVLLIVSLFLPWAGAEGADRTGFELVTMADALLLIVALVAIGAALTSGRFGSSAPICP